MARSIDVASVCKDSKSKHAPQIASVISNALDTLSPTQDSADKIAAEIDNLYPSDSAEAEDWLWTFWSVLVGVARVIPADDERQQLLVLTVAKLKTKRDQEVEMWGQRTRVWTELPMLGPIMRDAWSLTPNFNDSENLDPSSIDEWVSLNSFAARIYGLSLQDWHNFAIWELRFGLEEPIEDRPGVRDAIIATVYEWITHAGKELHRNGTESITLNAMETRALRPGSLFKSDQSGLSVERWNFWRERIGVLGAGAGSGLSKEKAQKALEAMKEIGG
ncbi:hypothetical protein E4U42_007370 [Claviceps africana]|uniref:Uncharacterized protein n=1 Tax=Claviceps africana TaxID=83212 RepID=A0A8K0J3Z6_9HYPO|nr:hypothetical protein E4U42_007370 [Claviceps africana]